MMVLTMASMDDVAPIAAFCAEMEFVKEMKSATKDHSMMMSFATLATPTADFPTVVMA